MKIGYTEDRGSEAESDVDAEEEQYYRDMAMTSTRVRTDPDGNVYRGWAVGVQKGNRQFMLTILVMLVQIFAPIAVINWSHRQFKEMEAIPILEYWSMIHNATHNGSSAASDWSIPSSSELFSNDKLRESLELKVLGLLFMLIIFFSTDGQLLLADMQTDKMRLYFRELKNGWMWADVVCNSWVSMLTCHSTLALFLNATDALTMVLDAFGLLFILKLDDYSADIEYGIETSDFDRIVEEYASRMRTEQYSTPDDEFVSKVMKERCQQGDWIYSLARLINLFLLCIQVPMFLTLQIEKEPLQPLPPDSSGIFSQLGKNRAYWLPISVTWILAWFMLRAGNFIKAKVDLSPDLEDDEDLGRVERLQNEEGINAIGRGDLFAFMVIVFLRRPDPRVSDLDPKRRFQG